MEKSKWHTDIVVDGQGLGLSLRKGKDGCYDLVVKPDVPGEKSGKALQKLKMALSRQRPVCGVNAARKKVARAVKETRARWNQWHRESY